ncbi:MAG: metallophosphoesterase [Solirubrobacterales bacterium]
MLFGKKKKRDADRTRILFATDLHAGERTFRKFLNSGKVYEPDVLILGGDLTGKIVAPVIVDGDRLTATVMDETVVEDDAGMRDVEGVLRDLGSYPVRVTTAEYERLQTDAEFREAKVEGLIVEQVERWLALAAERLAESGIPLYVTGGNDDPISMEEVLNRSTYGKNAESTVLTLPGEIEMASTGYGNPTPWPCPRDISEEELGERIESTVAEIERIEGSIFNFHVPPFDSTLDIAPLLDVSVDPPAVVPGETAPVGSHAVREAIERHQPMLSLHGHIHESRGIVQIGRTVCVNPGSEYGEGVLRAAVIDVVDGEVANAQLVAG